MKKITFENVCKQLRENSNFKEILDDLNAFSGAVILLLGIRSTSGDISAFLNALMIKDQLINIGKRILDKVTTKKTNEYDKRIDQIQWAYSIIYYTAFFDVLDEQMPLHVRDKIKLTLNEKKDIFQNVSLGNRERESLSTNTEIFFPNIVYGYDNIEKHLEKLYVSMCEGLEKFVHMLDFEESSNEETIGEFNNIIKEMPNLAIKRFKAQYLYLASNYNEFYIYIQIEEDMRKTLHIEELYKNTISIGCDTSNKIDVGLKHLEKVLLDLPEKIHEDKVKEIVATLIDTYKKDVEKPIIDSKGNDEKLKYPSIQKAFIPQSYKVLEYSGEEKLEKINTWKTIEEQDNMDSFWAKYYVSPHSLENLLLVLGEPGGGKSLLTKILCARMINSNNIFVRIPLREVSVEKEIEDIVREQIEKDGDASEPLPTFKWFAENFKYNPITLIFDGYDEVLQATGGVYRNLLRKILKFQEQCAERHRPVRIVITSRETLIDKADIPIGTIVLRLLEFNKEQRNKWMYIWNKCNSEVFEQEHINSFLLPEKNKSIEELSRQPLLLLMLAIYDANFEERINSLGKEENLNRTKLYNELLRRFIRRELRKGSRGNEISYEDSSDDEKELMVEQEMEKLGIAALGMFIRGKLSLKVDEMEQDLTYMEAQTPAYNSAGKMLSKAEEFFGSFFFIHDSQSGNVETNDKEVAFEFLHKTFYEFLIADLLLKYLVREIDVLDELQKMRRASTYQKAIEDPNHFGKQYYIALMNANLCTEPEIIEMIVEWKDNIIQGYFPGERINFDNIVSELFSRQVEMVCKDIFMPSVWNENLYGSIKKSYLQCCAVYFMNLLILQIITNKDSQIIIEKETWIILAQFWKMNIQEDILMKFLSLFSVTNNKEKMHVEKKRISDKIEQKNLLEKQIDISNFLQDDISCNFYKLHDLDIRNATKQKYRSSLLAKGIDMDIEILLGEMHEYILEGRVKYPLEEMIENLERVLFESRVLDTSLILELLLCINILVDKIPYKMKFRRYDRYEFIERVLKNYSDNHQIVLELFKYCNKVGALKARSRENFSYNTLDRIFYGNPKVMYEYIVAFEDHLSMKDWKFIINRVKEIDCESLIEAPQLIDKLLKISINFNADLVFDDLLHIIMDNIDKWGYCEIPIICDVIKLCIFQDKISEAEYILKCRNIDYIKWFRKYPEEVMDLLKLLNMMGNKTKEMEEIIHLIVKGYEEILHNEPFIAIKIIKMLILLDMMSEYEELIFILYKRYDRLFEMEPVEAIEFLNIANKYFNKYNDKYLTNALKYSLKFFSYLATKSLGAAIDLLVLCKKTFLNIYPYIQSCFNQILSGNIAVDMLKVFELIDCLDNDDLDHMAEFFLSRYLYIIMDFPELAKKITGVYCKTPNGYLYRDALYHIKHSHTVLDREYLLCLDELSFQQ